MNNGRLEITKESDGTFGNGLTVAAGGGAVEVVNAGSTMSITADDTHNIQLNGALTITGAGNMITGCLLYTSNLWMNSLEAEEGLPGDDGKSS